jgi:hypothetical protein
MSAAPPPDASVPAQLEAAPALVAAPPRRRVPPHRLGAFSAAIAAGAILVSALAPAVMAEIPLLASALVLLFVFGRYLLWPRLFPGRHALQLVDRERTRMLAAASALSLIAAALAWRRRIPGLADPPPPAELALGLLPLGCLLASVVALSALHRRIVDHALWRPPGDRQASWLRWVAPVLAALYLPAAGLASGWSTQWQARMIFADLGQGTGGWRPEPLDRALAAALAELLWASEPRTQEQLSRLRAQTEALLPGPDFTDVEALIETRLGLRPERRLATLGPGEESEATARFRTIAAGARRPFVGIWKARDRCRSPRLPDAQESLWLLANVCHPDDSAAAAEWLRGVTHPWLRPDSRWRFGAVWTVRPLPSEEGTVAADGSLLLQQAFGKPDQFEQEVLGQKAAPACAGRDWKVVHVWRPPTERGGATWEGGIALSRRTKVCWADPGQQTLRFGNACLRDGRVQLKVPIALVVRAVDAPAGPLLSPADRRLHADVFGKREGKRCLAPSPHLAVRQPFLLQSAGPEEGEVESGQ